MHNTHSSLPCTSLVYGNLLVVVIDMKRVCACCLCRMSIVRIYLACQEREYAVFGFVVFVLLSHGLASKHWMS